MVKSKGNWVKVYASAQRHLVEIAKAILAEEGIESVVLNNQDSAYITFGYIELYANKENALRASNILNNSDL